MMYPSDTKSLPHSRQGGFIQGAILFALVIVAVVVAAFSLANRDSQTSADAEQARVNASFVLKVGTDLQSGINRAIADGMQPSQVSTSIALDDTESSGTTINLFDGALKYLSRPEFPATALATGETQPFFGTDGLGDGATASFATDTALSGAGSTAGLEAIITIPGLAQGVCQRINNSVNGELVTADPPTTFAVATGTGAGNRAWREGCFGSGPYTYFRAVVTDAS